ncbi:MAG: SBBP repeat-containing protein, partial [Cyclobacteriaceae bacterium]|nr:SBBP repeat-containing protein [Cyclobacteriaceae bacterium]
MRVFKATTVLFLFFSLFYLSYLAFHLILPDNKTETTYLNYSSGKVQSQVDLKSFKMKMHFEPNLGQVDESVQFISRGKGYTLFLTPNEAVLSLQESNDTERTEQASSVVHMRFAGANCNPQINGHNEFTGKSNYFLGNNPDEWQTNIPNYSSVEYKKVYHGIDLVYYGSEGQLEYDFMVSPNGNPEDIVLHFDDQDKPKIDKQGNLVFMDKNQKLFMKPPVAYQTRKDAREIIEATYAYVGENQIGFDIGDYDMEIPLVIDPVIIFSTYLGNSSGADAQAIAVDSAGNAYITGTTGALKFPTTHNNLVPNFTGPQHVFITKMNAEGTELIYSTYFGGHNDDVPKGIAVDGEGNILVVGRAMSDDFPLVNAIQT